MSYFECFLIMVALLGQRVLLPEGAHHHNRSTKQNKIACSFDASMQIFVILMIQQKMAKLRHFKSITCILKASMCYSTCTNFIKKLS